MNTKSIQLQKTILSLNDIHQAKVLLAINVLTQSGLNKWQKLSLKTIQRTANLQSKSSVEHSIDCLEARAFIQVQRVHNQQNAYLMASQIREF